MWSLSCGPFSASAAARRALCAPAGGSERCERGGPLKNAPATFGDNADLYIGRAQLRRERRQTAPEPESRKGTYDAIQRERRLHADRLRQRAGGEVAERRDAEKRHRVETRDAATQAIIDHGLDDRVRRSCGENDAAPNQREQHERNREDG